MAEHAHRLVREIETLKSADLVKLTAMRWLCSIYLAQVKDEQLKIDLAQAWKKIHVMYHMTLAVQEDEDEG